MDASQASPPQQAVILVEGRSDAAAVAALAARRGRDLTAEGVGIVAMGGATNIGHAVDAYGPHGRRLRLAGLCDEAEEGYFRRALQRAGLVAGGGRADLEAAGFFVCEADLEYELIRAVGLAGVERIVASQGELRSLRTFQAQPAQQGRSPQDQLHRFLGTRSGRKISYARLLVCALDPGQVPRPLAEVLARA